jgi:hypothetical protein
VIIFHVILGRKYEDREEKRGKCERKRKDKRKEKEKI